MCPEEPEAEENEIEEVFEDVVVHQGKQLRMVLNDYGDTCDACDIEQISAYQAKRDEPQLFLPWTTGHEHDDNPDKCLLQSRTAPSDVRAITIVKIDVVACTEMRVVGDEGYQPIYDASNMIGHHIENSRQIDAQPHDLNTLLVTKHGELPEVVRR